MYKTSRFFRLFILLMIVLAQPAAQASAAMSRCRTDPIFTLSNGDVVTVILDVGTDPANVKEVSYILHVPAGVTPTRIEFTPGILGEKEKFQVIQDSPDGFYTSDSVLKTTKVKTAVEVTAHMDVNSIYFQSATGYDEQHLIIKLTSDTRTPPTSDKVSTFKGSVNSDGKTKADDGIIIIVATATP